MKPNARTTVMMGIAFVWFTTQFGGGFATGNQLRQYFVDFGAAAILTMVFSQAVMGLIYWYCLRFARKHETYDYRSYNNAFFGKFAPFFSNAFEVIYALSVLAGTAAAFATSAATLSSAFGVNYWVSIIGVGIFIFVITLFGTSLVRKTASVLSIAIVIGLVAIYVPNIIMQWDNIQGNLSISLSSPLPWVAAIYMAFVYGIFQSGALGVMCVQAKALEKPSDANGSMLIGLVINSVVGIMAILGLMSVMYDEAFATAEIPLLILVEQGVAPGVFQAVISILIILGSVSTGVNLVSGFTARVCTGIDKSFDPTAKPGTLSIAVTAVVTVACFCVAQFGLTAIVGYGYRYVGTAGIFCTFIPYVIHMIYTKFDSVDRTTAT